ncbi:hypothetical protein DE146DRAFT_732752 [Phaeosphaeria sp. MPI-PUGE-AT-0046c]|nr:hypothetical protein DE146DRAFT_732752 [Phaeosphaeria sp. MPI-PUGE-AT-0046c]
MAESRAAKGGNTASSAVTEMHQARQIQAKWTKKDDDIESELKNLETRRRELKTMRLMNWGQYEDWYSNAHKCIFVPLSKAWNLAFAESMQTKLPRELRDMIYGYVIDYSINHDLWSSTITYITGGEINCGVAGLSNLCDANSLPPILCPGYVGSAIEVEAVHALYSALRGHLTLGASAEYLHNVLSGDPFCAGFAPKEVVRSLNISCKLDHYRTRPLRHALTNDCNHTIEDTYYIDQARLKADLDEILSVKDKKHLRLRLILLQRNVRVAILHEAIEIIRDSRRTLITAGSNLDIQWAYNGQRGLFQQDRHSGHDWVRFQMGDEYFDRPREEWEELFTTFLRPASSQHSSSASLSELNMKNRLLEKTSIAARMEDGASRSRSSAATQRKTQT